MNRPVIAILSFLVFVCLVVIVVLGVLLSQEPRTCQSAECISFAASTMAAMNLSADPCHDFYDYACGRWVNTVDIPEGSPKYSTFSNLIEINNAILQKRIASPGNDYMGRDSSAVHNAKKFYNTCLNRTAIDERGATPLLQYISEIGSCPLLSGVRGAGRWDSYRWSLVETTVSLHKFDTTPFFFIWTAPDLTTDYYIMWFYQSGLSLFNKRDFYMGNNTNATEEYHQGWVEYVSTLFTMLGATDDVSSQVEEIYQFEAQLAQIFDPPESRNNMTLTYNKMSVAELKTLTEDWFDMDAYLKSYVGADVEDSEDVILKSPDYFRKLSTLMSGTSKNVIANYMVASAIQDQVRYLSSTFLQTRLRYKREMLGGARDPDPEKDCLIYLNNFMYDLMGGLYIEEAFSDPRLKDDIVKQLDNIKVAFAQRVDQLDWMDEETKQRAQRKVETLTAQVAYPEIVKHPEQLDSKFELYTFTDNFFSNIRLGNELGTAKNLEKRGRLPNKNEWSSGANNVNAFYHPMFNRMVFLAGILNPPFYGAHFPTAMNYGAIGTVMGHEITHGFDVRGRQLDHDGKLVNWWSTYSEEAFQDRAQCLVDQYDGFPIGDSHVNGQMTVGENMADNGGIKSAYDAYTTWSRSHEDTYDTNSLPGLEMNSKQLFFLGFAQSWCSYITDQYALVTISTDLHTQPKYRVIGVLQNSEEFSEAFQCPVGSRMNPETKCVTW